MDLKSKQSNRVYSIKSKRQGSQNEENIEIVLKIVLAQYRKHPLT